MSENPVISNPEEGDNTLYSGVSGNKSPGNGTKERRISVEKKIELKNSSPESKNSKEKKKDNDYSATQLRRPSKECGQVEGVLDETARASPDKASKVSEEKQLDEKPSEMTEAEEIPEINQTSSTVSGCRSEDSELGIVGPATAAENILHDDELLDPAKDQAETVAEWMERSSLHKSKTTLKNKNNTKELSGQGATTTTRKSQRIVSSIIKRSIKCALGGYGVHPRAVNGVPLIMTRTHTEGEEKRRLKS
ncbi:hypothetical protein KQX54_016241 [Cotesia glomerata]|uniref:Uncharacterized protein n=1 Tax=Cotesia glomerata TaxID=32391 RepID=A0AAV7IVW9_COTGL|nr:hypothetical protein KQX54_016241 [Cotesia glomerata]